MNIFNRLGRAGRRFGTAVKQIFNDLALNNPKAWNPSLWTLHGSVSLSGETVTEETALTYSPVWNAVNLISTTVASLPLHLMKKSGESAEIYNRVKLYRLLHDQPNEYMTAQAFRECMCAHILTNGNCYAEKAINSSGEVVELWPIPPNRVVNIQMFDGGLWYEIRLDDGNRWFPREKIMHIPGLGFDGFIGYSPIAMARRSLGLGMAMETFGSNYFGHGTHPGMIITHPGKLTAEAHSNLKKSLTEAHSGLGQEHRLMLLEEGMSLETVTIDPQDSQFLESRQFQIPEVARWFNLPPHKLKDLTKSSFSNIESEQISFVTDSILPWLIRFEQNYNMQLLSPMQKSRGLYYNHVVEGLLRGNSKDRADLYKAMFSIGAMSPNDIRKKEDMNPIKGGDIYLVPLNMVSVENAGKIETQQSLPAPSENPTEGQDNNLSNIITFEPINTAHDKRAIDAKTSTEIINKIKTGEIENIYDVYNACREG